MATTLDVTDGSDKFVPKSKNTVILIADGIDSFLCKGFKRITPTRAEFELYEPISPTGAKLVMEWIRSEFESSHDGKEKTVFPKVEIGLLDSIGIQVQRWELIEPSIRDCNFDNYFNTYEPTCIHITLEYARIETIFG